MNAANDPVDPISMRATSRRVFVTGALAWGMAPLWTGRSQEAPFLETVEFNEASVKRSVEDADQKRRADVAESFKALEALAEKFTNALKGLRPTLQNRGVLEDLDELDRELADVTTGVTVQQDSQLPEIKKLQDIYAREIDKAAPNLRESIRKAEDVYHRTLDEIVEELIRNGNTADARVVTALKKESARRIELLKTMVDRRQDHINLCDEVLGRVIESPINDGRNEVAFGRSVDRPVSKDNQKDKITFKEAIYTPTKFEGKISIVEYDIPPGFTKLSFVGVGAFSEHIWARVTTYRIEVDPGNRASG
jgi:hypothetical protein